MSSQHVTFERAFAASERQFFQEYPVTIIPAVTVEGVLELDVLNRAWEYLTIQQPVLGSHCELRDFEPWLVAASSANPLQVSNRSLADGLREVESLKPDVALAALEVIQDGSRAVVMLKVHHAIADAHSAFAWFFQLWVYYTRLATGQSLESAVTGQIPASIESHLCQRGVTATEGRCQAIDLAALRSAVLVPRPPPDSPLCHYTFELGIESTAALKAHVKSKGTTVHAALSGAVLLAERTLLTSSSTAVPMAVVSPVDVRNAVTPQIPLHAVTNGIGYVYTVVPVSPASDPLSVGNHVRQVLRDQLNNGEAARSALHVADWITASHQLGPFSIITNFGAYPPLPMTSGLQCLGISLLRPDYARTPPHPAYVVSTLDDKLTFSFHYCGEQYGQGTVEHLIIRLEQIMHDLADAA